ncbi:peptide transporter family 1 isoform X1 [Athalia rosae]|uniref:peptide transporter family 1 isoform X1 n=2 Tax=Athalia rosae TaxID=37344 RepID=UPI0020343052|nr:peptide transporter family 1 isoform X1 [Athalia rosae]
MKIVYSDNNVDDDSNEVMIERRDDNAGKMCQSYINDITNATTSNILHHNGNFYRSLPQDVKKFKISADHELLQSRHKLKYPRSVLFIISNEFCERFSYYGIRTIMVLYLRNKLLYDDDTATVIFHAFAMLAYFTPLLGAMMADSWLGKFRTIFYVSIIYAVGQLVLAASAAPPFNLPDRAFAIIGLILIAVGTGGIKPCVAAFGGDQFVLPQQERALVLFFSLFYFSINSGSLISTFVSPILRQDVSCFGENTCYSLAFFVPAVLMIVSIVIFVLGKPLYIVKSPEGNVVAKVVKCIWHGLGNKIKAKKGDDREYWLDHADDKYDPKFISDIRSALGVIKMFLPLPVFWALFDQQGSRWTIQATRMNGQIGSFVLKPDQIGFVNPLLILLFIPMFETCIYPALNKIHLVRTPLQKLTFGGILAGLAFVISGVVELQLEKTYPVLPSSGLTQLRIFNTLDCQIPMTVGNDSFVLENLGIWENKYIEASGDVTINYSANFAQCSAAGITNSLPGDTSGTLTGQEAQAVSWVVTKEGITRKYIDNVGKTTSGNPAIRSLVHLNSAVASTGILRFVKDSKSILNIPVSSKFVESELEEINADTYDIYFSQTLIKSSVEFKSGGIYAITAYINDLTSAKGNIITITDPNSMHILWVLPQYIVMTLGEVMFSVTGLQFAFTQAAVSMKSLLQAVWLLTVAFGNLIVVVIAEAAFFDSQASEFFLFAGLMFVDMLIFAGLAWFYKYVTISEDEDQTDGDINLTPGKKSTFDSSIDANDAKS